MRIPLYAKCATKFALALDLNKNYPSALLKLCTRKRRLEPKFIQRPCNDINELCKTFSKTAYSTTYSKNENHQTRGILILNIPHIVTTCYTFNDVKDARRKLLTQSKAAPGGAVFKTFAWNVVRSDHPKMLMRFVQVLTPIPQLRQTVAALCGLPKKQFNKKPNDIIGIRVVNYLGALMSLKVILWAIFHYISNRFAWKR